MHGCHWYEVKPHLLDMVSELYNLSKFPFFNIWLSPALSSSPTPYALSLME